MANLKSDSPISRRIVRAFFQFLNSVELPFGVDGEALDVAKDCLSEVFKIDESSLDESSSDSLVRIFGSFGGIADSGTTTDKVTLIKQPPSSLGRRAEEVLAASQTSVDMGKELHSLGEAGDEIFGIFVNALEKCSYFRRLPDGNDDQVQLDVATNLFHIAVKEMETSGCQSFDQKTLAETFKSLGNKAMQSKIYSEAVDLYTFAIALSENNAIYYCNRAAAYTHVQDYTKAIQDCLRSVQINPNYSKAYSRLGFAYYAQGNYRDAIDNGFRRALQLDPDNESVKENIRVAEQKLKDEQQRAGSGQSSTSSGHHGVGGGWRSNAEAPSPFISIPVNSNDLHVDLNGMLMNMAGNAFAGEAHQNRHNRGAREDDALNDPAGISVGGSASADANELPGGVSDALRSMMGIYPGAAFHRTKQQEE